MKKVVVIPLGDGRALVGVTDTEDHASDCPLVNGSGDRSGPSTVVSDAYRAGWDNIFGKRQEVGQT